MDDYGRSTSGPVDILPSLSVADQQEYALRVERDLMNSRRKVDAPRLRVRSPAPLEE